MEINKKQIILTLMVIVLIGVFIVFQLEHEQNNTDKTKEIFRKAKFTIGTIIEYNPFVSHFRGLDEPANVTVKFTTKDSIVTGIQSEDDFFTPRQSLELNKKYLVIYDSADATNFRILFDSPISDSTDFKKYLLDSNRILKDIDHSNFNKVIKK